jgi:quercetin dioxygenase-like cupin family protein
LDGPRPRRLAVFSCSRSALFAGVILLSASSVVAYAAGAARQSPAQASRTVLAQAVDPPGGRGRTLALSRVKIPSHTRLALHRHPGVQLAYVQRGTLTYTVKRGVVKVYRGSADEDPRVVRRISDGQTGRVNAGEWVIERPRVVHFGANDGDRPVVILLATLFKNGKPTSIPVPEQPPAHGAVQRSVGVTSIARLRARPKPHRADREGARPYIDGSNP